MDAFVGLTVHVGAGGHNQTGGVQHRAVSARFVDFGMTNPWNVLVAVAVSTGSFWPRACSSPFSGRTKTLAILFAGCFCIGQVYGVRRFASCFVGKLVHIYLKTMTGGCDQFHHLCGVFFRAAKQAE